ncbi:unnamed protein product [Gongylonema pulchrum]|uniref:Histone acetyltransferase n=1 Tax=Gongylonema pulchrum TaxID=637853 RepID=A0A183DW39_9BILA|nr:unnamed protein product [Gongylonema pulchrum]
MPEAQLKDLLCQMCELSQEQQRLFHGRQVQFHTLHEVYNQVKEDIEKLYIRVPARLRLDLPLPQALQSSTASNEDLPEVNGGATATCQLEQRLRIPSLFDVPHGSSAATAAVNAARANSGNDGPVEIREEGGGRGGGALGTCDEAGTEATARTGGGGSSSSIQTSALKSAAQTTRNTDQATSFSNNDRPYYSALNGPGHMNPADPSTSTCDDGSKPLFSRHDLREDSRFSGTGPAHEIFSKTGPEFLRNNSSGHCVSLGNFENSSSFGQISHATGRPLLGAAENSSAYHRAAPAPTQTSASSNKLSSEGVDTATRMKGQHSLMHSGLQDVSSFASLMKPPSPAPAATHPDFPVPLRTVGPMNPENSCRHDSSQPYHSTFKQTEMSRPQLPNLSEPPPPIGAAPMTNSEMLSNQSGTAFLSTMQNSNLPPTQQALSSTGAGFAPSCSSPSVQSLSSNASTTAVNALPVISSTSSQNLQAQSSASSLLAALHSGSTAVSIPPPDFSVPPPMAPPFTAPSTRTNLTAAAPATVTKNNLMQSTFGKESVGMASTDSAAAPSNAHIQRTVQASLTTEVKEVLPGSMGLPGFPAMNVPPPSFSVPPPRAPPAAATAPPAFSTPPPMAPGGAASGSRASSLAAPMSTPSLNIISGASVNLNCPPPDMSQPPPNIRNSMSASNSESVQQMVSAIVNQSAVSGQSPVDVVTEMIANAYGRSGGLRLHDVLPLSNQRVPNESAITNNKTRAPTTRGPPRPLSSIGKLVPPLRRSPSVARAAGGAASSARSPNFNKQKGRHSRTSKVRPHIRRQKRHISDVVAIIPDEHEVPNASESQSDNIFLIMSDDEDDSK